MRCWRLALHWFATALPTEIFAEKANLNTLKLHIYKLTVCLKSYETAYRYNININKRLNYIIVTNKSVRGSQSPLQGLEPRLVVGHGSKSCALGDVLARTQELKDRGFRVYQNDSESAEVRRIQRWWRFWSYEVMVRFRLGLVSEFVNRWSEHRIEKGGWSWDAGLTVPPDLQTGWHWHLVQETGRWTSRCKFTCVHVWMPSVSSGLTERVLKQSITGAPDDRTWEDLCQPRPTKHAWLKCYADFTG